MVYIDKKKTLSHDCHHAKLVSRCLETFQSDILHLAQIK